MPIFFLRIRLACDALLLHNTRSAKHGIAVVSRPSVRLSVRPSVFNINFELVQPILSRHINVTESVTLMCRESIGWTIRN